MIVLKSYIRKKKRKETKARLSAAGRVLDVHSAWVNVGIEGNQRDWRGGREGGGQRSEVSEQ